MNYTPIDVNKFQKDNNALNKVLLVIAIITAFVLIVLLFVLIQKKSSTYDNQTSVITPTVMISPTPEPTTEITPTEMVEEATPSSKIATPESQLSPTINE